MHKKVARDVQLRHGLSENQSISSNSQAENDMPSNLRRADSEMENEWSGGDKK